MQENTSLHMSFTPQNIVGNAFEEVSQLTCSMHCRLGSGLSFSTSRRSKGAAPIDLNVMNVEPYTVEGTS